MKQLRLTGSICHDDTHSRLFNPYIQVDYWFDNDTLYTYNTPLA
jgi:hypothetical protein